MTSLSYVTEHIKMLGKWIGITLAVIIGLIFLFRFIFFVKEMVSPTPPPPPTVTWGKLPSIVFPQSPYTQQFSYTINTLSGQLPVLPDRMTVNLLATPEASLQSLSSATNLVENVDFDEDTVRIAESIYQWTKTDYPNDTLNLKLQYDIVSKNFAMSSNYISNADVISANNLPDDIDAQADAEDFLSNLDAFPAGLNATKSAITFFSIENGALQKTTSLSNAQIIRIDFFQKDINNLPIYYPQYPYSPMYVLVGGGAYQANIVEVEYIHHTITDTSATYPILSVTKAFDQLKKGNAYVASYKGGNTTIGIKNVKLGYYLAGDSKTYLMPIIVFEGNDDFVAYVSAITAQWISK